MEIFVKQVLTFRSTDLRGYLTFRKPPQEISIEIKGTYSPPHFVGTFEGYSKATLDITSVHLERKEIVPTKRLLAFLVDRFLEVLVSANIEEDNDS